MKGLERNSHDSCGCPVDQRATIPGRISHLSREVLPRHRHDVPYAAIVLSGSYVEAGDTGLHRVGPGDIIIHQPYESHLDRFSTTGAEVFTLDLREYPSDGILRRIEDPDAIVRLAESDAAEAADVLVARSVVVTATLRDWPETLAADLLADPTLSIRQWAYERRLHPGSVGRGFRQQFGITAAAFRANARGHHALRNIRLSAQTLSGIAAGCRFADQAHMTRVTRRMTGHAPARLRTICQSDS